MIDFVLKREKGTSCLPFCLFKFSRDDWLAMGKNKGIITRGNCPDFLHLLIGDFWCNFYVLLLEKKMLPPIKQYLNKILTDIPQNHISNSYIAFSKGWINILAAMAMTEMVSGCFKTLNIFYMITCIAAGKVWWKGVKKKSWQFTCLELP